MIKSTSIPKKSKTVTKIISKVKQNGSTISEKEETMEEQQKEQKVFLMEAVL